MFGNDPNKPGWQTTEFWKTLIAAGLSLATALGVIGPTLAQKYQAQLSSIALLATAVIIGAYTLGRSIIKVARTRPVSPATVVVTDPQAPVSVPPVTDTPAAPAMTAERKTRTRKTTQP